MFDDDFNPVDFMGSTIFESIVFSKMLFFERN